MNGGETFRDGQGPFEEGGGFDEAAGTFEGRAFPSEAEWLSLPSPPITADFVDRTVAALHAGGAEEDTVLDASANAGEASDALTPERLAAFAAPAPTRDFAARTLRAVQADRTTHWRELLARYIAPDPSPDFVARTLAALLRRTDTVDPRPMARQGRNRAWFSSLLLLAAAATVLVLLQEPPRAPVELRIAQQVRPALAHAYAASPLPAMLAGLDRQQDPDALPNGEADGMWLLRRDR